MRNDIHKPSAIVPSDYQFVACEHLKTEGDIGLCLLQNEYREIIKRHMASTGGTYSHHEHGGNCHVCGSVNMIYSILYYHEKSNSYIRVGEDCANNIDMSGTGEMNRFRSAMRDAIEAKAGKGKAIAILEKAGLSKAWEIYQNRPTGSLFDPVISLKMVQENYKQYEEKTIVDIVGKLVQYGNVSDKALAFVGRLLEKIDNRPSIEAAKAIERENSADCPTGRIVVTGEILSMRQQDSDFGIVTKMLVKDDSGFKVWCSSPNSAESHGKGDRVSFTVSLEPSRDDKKFGFGKRPSKLTVIKPYSDNGLDS